MLSKIILVGGGNIDNYFENIQKYFNNGHTEDLENRIERLRKYIDEILLYMCDTQERRCDHIGVRLRRICYSQVKYLMGVYWREQ
ncbi:hypothetical protein acsn021_01480 [Anaerocolumna cellulosilytica]|uniref:Uncharacterized protein n=1 Tax=Anaerocolumna cellulosilytica TaxID=433286 RepID=A0A6S6QU11_9FIRM|nr:hypothetical protein [Anaerocolumna cellulosilytica]MBB5197949.1 hypothetical protein [Anaerocolumna cellulosilytica]BCJ92579.1 hypothetical protein acsn021_01480 [Anaerocolumna cellulosilytica]